MAAYQDWEGDKQLNTLQSEFLVIQCQETYKFSLLPILVASHEDPWSSMRKHIATLGDITAAHVVRQRPTTTHIYTQQLAT